MVKLRKQLNENPALKEFIHREHAEFKEIVKAVQKATSEVMVSSNVGVQGALQDLTAAVNKHDHNFTYYANKSLELQKQHNLRIEKTLVVLDQELKMG